MKIRRLLLLGTMPVALLAMAPGAMATPRFANPTDIGTGDCLSAPNACDLQTAVESASATDDVTILPGTYNEGTNPLTVPIDVTVHGQAGQPKPDLNFGVPSMSNVAVSVNTGGVLRRVKITSTDPTISNRALAFVGTVEQVEVNGAVTTCDALAGVIRDSFCRSTANSGTGLRAQSTAATIAVKARNVTAQATGLLSTGIRASAVTGGNITLDAVNVIADGVANDAGADAGAASTATLTLDHSNYATAAVGMGGGTESVTLVGSNASNQTTPPGLAGDGFHVLSGPTINAGVTDAFTGLGDIDGDARVQGAAIDIGADEFTPPPPLPGGSTATPAAAGPTGQRAAALKKCKKKKGAARKRCKKKAAKLPV